MVFYSSWSVFTVVGFVIFLHSTYVKTKFRQAPHHPSFAGLLHFVLPAYITFAIWDFDCKVVRYLEHCIAPVQVKFGSCLQVCCPSSSRYVGAGCVCVCVWTMSLLTINLGNFRILSFYVACTWHDTLQNCYHVSRYYADWVIVITHVRYGSKFFAAGHWSQLSLALRAHGMASSTIHMIFSACCSLSTWIKVLIDRLRLSKHYWSWQQCHYHCVSVMNNFIRRLMARRCNLIQQCPQPLVADRYE